MSGTGSGAIASSINMREKATPERVPPPGWAVLAVTGLSRISAFTTVVAP